MLRIDGQDAFLEGVAGTLPVPPDDEITRKPAMPVEGECEGLGATAAARKFGFCRQRYHQLLLVFKTHGAAALLSRKRGPKLNYRRTDWESGHPARDLFAGLDGDLGVQHDPTVVTFYAAPKVDQLPHHYEHLDPRIPWLYNFKLDFRFK